MQIHKDGLLARIVYKGLHRRLTASIKVCSNAGEGDRSRLICEVCFMESCVRCGASPFHHGLSCEEEARRSALMMEGYQRLELGQGLVRFTHFRSEYLLIREPGVGCDRVPLQKFLRLGTTASCEQIVEKQCRYV